MTGYPNLILAGGLLFAACVTTTAGNESKKKKETVVTNNYITIPIEPFPVAVSTNSHAFEINPQAFPNTDFSLSLEQFQADGSVGFVVGTASATGGFYSEIVDFKRYFTCPVPLDGTNGTTDYAYLQIGLAYRAKIDFKLLSGSINAGFSGFTAGVSASNIDGNISFSLYGVTNITAQSSVPMPSEVTPDKIEEYFQSLAIVKNVVYQPDVPQVIAVNPAGHTVSQVLDTYYQILRSNGVTVAKSPSGSYSTLIIQKP